MSALAFWSAACGSGGAGKGVTDAAAGGGRGGAVTTTGGSTATIDGGPSTGTGGTTGDAGSCCKQFGNPSAVGTIASSELTELSGLVASRGHPGVLYAHADSGGGAVIYAIATTGETIGTFTLSGLRPDDWEDIAIGPGPGAATYIYLGDTGDNAARTGSGTPRSDISVYRVAEPAVAVGLPVGAQTMQDYARLRFVYPDAPHDCETLMVDPQSGDILLVTKEEDAAPRVYRAAGTTPADTTTVLELVATLALPGPSKTSGMITAGDIAPSGDSIVIRNYATIFLWCRAGSWAATFAAPPTELRAASEPQGEALTFSFDGQAWYSASESSTTISRANASCAP